MKGHYKKARAGEIKEFTGISSPYEVPWNPEVRLNTDEETIEKCVDAVIHYLVNRGVIGSEKYINKMKKTDTAAIK